MTISEVAVAPARHERTARKAATAPRRAAEWAPFPEQNARRLARALAGEIAGEVRFSAGDRALYATDGSNYRQVPIGIVLPRSPQDVIATVALCREHGAPVLSRGGGTSLAGQCCNTAVVMDFSKYLNHILTIDPEGRVAWVEPGTVLDDLRDAAEKHHLTFGPDPSTHDHNTLGGMIGNNSCGVHSVMSGRTADNVLELDILTYDGLRLRVGPTSEDELQSIIARGGRRAEIYRQLDALRWRYAPLIRERYRQIPRRVSGYNLDELLPEHGFNVARALVGTEGTCVTVLKAGLRLVPSPPKRVLVVAGFPDIFIAGDAVVRVLSHEPLGLEGIDERLVNFMRIKHEGEAARRSLPEGCGWLLAEMGGETEAEAIEKAEALMRDLGRDHDVADVRLLRDPAAQKRIWEVRKAGLGATAFVPHHPDTWEGWEDSAVPPHRVGPYLRDLDALFKKYDYSSALYGHFGDGCIHCRINFGLRTEAGVAKWRRFLDEAADLVLRHEGSVSGEHGDGQSKAELLGKMYGPELIQAFREFKAIWDPEGKMNPGKVVDPYPITSNLRLGPDYRPPQLKTHFHFKPEGGSFERVALRCVGVGECRRHHTDNGVMCPSYMATMEEKHSTRGRGHLLFEMLHGGAITDRWKSDAVEEALDLCLGCKGCKHDCPVNVDMATYKAEFRSHYYEGRLRPRAAYSMGLIHLWARAASFAPGVANFLTQTPGVSAVAKFIGGLAQERRIPPFAPETFRQWFARHQPRHPLGPPVILFPDTFNNFFRPTAAIAAVHVLEQAGWRVVIPHRLLCCARPLYDWGMLDRAKGLIGDILETLGPDLERNIAVVGLEPACVSAFRDEIVDLFPDDPRAQRLKNQSFLFAEFLDKYCAHLELPRRAVKAMVQIHCHHHAVLDPKAEQKVLERMGVDTEIMPSGCCGMAGSFGFEAEKHHWSMKIAERVLLPKLAKAAPDTLVLADGFSCREQIEQGSGRETRHLAEAVAESLGFECEAISPREATARNALIAGGIAATAVLLGAFALSRSRRAAATRP